jgi:hypothetical protein
MRGKEEDGIVIQDTHRMVIQNLKVYGPGGSELTNDEAIAMFSSHLSHLASRARRRPTTEGGFTWADVELLWNVSGDVHSCYHEGLDSLADRIAALLPPRTDG